VVIAYTMVIASELCGRERRQPLSALPVMLVRRRSGAN
jgi:hypothetical protein